MTLSAQLDLFKPAFPARLEKVLGKMCVKANTLRDEYEKRIWYRVKDVLLARYGTLVGIDIQRIRRECYRCDGTGMFHYWYDDGGEWCFHCKGTGVWEWEFNFLHRYELFGQIFHRPYSREITKDKKAYCWTIKGRIQHEANEYQARRAFLALAIIFTPRIAWNVMSARWNYMIQPWQIKQKWWEMQRAIGWTMVHNWYKNRRTNSGF